MLPFPSSFPLKRRGNVAKPNRGLLSEGKRMEEVSQVILFPAPPEEDVRSAQGNECHCVILDPPRHPSCAQKMEVPFNQGDIIRFN
ncbi:hypothetical protein TNCV_730301 [Trichonephila clavipes]|nr:hypothetical protein TNCV_730301 [Trichonephila clavipes]